MFTKKALAASVSAGPAVYVESVFQSWLYTGNGSTQTITNGIDLAGKGGLVWIKKRSAIDNHVVFDSARGITKQLIPNLTNAESTDANAVTAFNSDGFSLGSGGSGFTNESAATYASWTFRKAAKFFDVVTYTGTGSNRTVAHNLGSVPGCIIVKRTNTTADWQVYHRSLANTEYMVLNSTAAKATGATRWNSTTPTSTVFSLGTEATVNASGGTYVAYLFAHDAGGFGDAGDQSVVKCGSYTGTGSSPGPRIELGWEPQFILYKAASTTGDWGIHDSMRGLGVGTSASSGTGNRLEPNTSDAESGAGNFANIDATGFTITPTVNDINGNGQTYIYIAIRRGPMKTPTDATKVFDVDTAVGTTAAQSLIQTGFPVDLSITRPTSSGVGAHFADRLRGGTSNSYNLLVSSSTAAEVSSTGYAYDFAYNNGIRQTVISPGGSGTELFYNFRRAPGFFDVVAYTGTGSARTVSHNLGVVPELMIVKKRSAADNWVVYAGDATDYLILNTTAATADLDTMWNDTAPTSAVFSLGTNDDVNGNTATFIAYLFATAPGVSKVGSYTGTGTTLNIDCGFTNGARFVLIKRTDSTGDWYVWDTARGIISGNDPYLLLNSTAAEVTNTDYIDPLSSGFQISSTAPAAINASGGTYIFHSVA